MTREYKKINFVPFNLKRVLRRNEADIVLSVRRDMCDFFALGLFCLRRAITSPDQTTVKVCYSYREFTKPSDVSAIIREKSYNIPRNAIEKQVIDNSKTILNYMFEDNIFNGIVGIMIYPVFTANVKGISKSPYIQNAIMSDFNLKDTVAAQEMAYKILCGFLDYICPFVPIKEASEN